MRTCDSVLKESVYALVEEEEKAPCQSSASVKLAGKVLFPSVTGQCRPMDKIVNDLHWRIVADLALLHELCGPRRETNDEIVHANWIHQFCVKSFRITHGPLERIVIKIFHVLRNRRHPCDRMRTRSRAIAVEIEDGSKTTAGTCLPTRSL